MRKKRHKITKEHKLEMLRLYTEEKKDLHAIASIFQTDRNRVARFIKELGVRVITKKKLNFDIDENYFNIIDTPSKAYVLGFLYADGYNGENRGVITIRVAKQDEEVLHFIKKELRAGSLIKECKYNKKRWPHRQIPMDLHIWNIFMSKALAKLGCMQSKSLILKFPTKNQVPEHLIYPFIKGYFDGDGSIFKHEMKNGNRGSYVLNFVGTFSFLTDLKEILEKELGALPSIQADQREGRKNILYRFNIHQIDQILKFYTIIYGLDTKFCLNRKLQKFKDMITFSETRKTIRVSKEDKKEITRLYNEEGLRNKDLMKLYGVCSSYISNIINKK